MSTLVVEPGATVFVTGVNGLIGSYVVDELLKRGYHVRGAVRDTEKSQWLVDHFKGRYDAEFSLVSVPDMTAEGCYDEVIKGTAGFIHVAAAIGNHDYNSAVPISVSSVLNALKSSAKTPSVKRVVLTSSSIAATFPSVGKEKVLTEGTYNEEGVAKGRKHPENEPPYMKGMYVYAAMKTESEMAGWKWVEENAPGFVLNTVLPNCNFSRVINMEKQGTPSTIEWAKAAFVGENLETLAKIIEPQFYISTQDCALLHVAALIYPDVESKRLFGFAEKWDFNKILAVYRKTFPERKFQDDIPGLGEDQTKPPTEKAVEVLKRMKGGKGWDTLEETTTEMARQFGEHY